MKLSQETVDKESSLPKHKAKKHSTRKTIGCFAETIDCLYQFANIKTEFKELRERECTQRFILVHSKPRATSSLLINH